MSTSIDLSRTSGLVDLGTHTFLVTDRSSEEMGPSGDPVWRVICKVVSPGDNLGKEVMHNISLGAKSRWKMDEFLDGIGAPKKGKGDLGMCIGKKFRASVSHDTYQGKEKTVLQTILQAPKNASELDAPSEVSIEDEALPSDVYSDDDEGSAEQVEAPTRSRF
jgi:hypothetical protein